MLNWGCEWGQTRSRPDAGGGSTVAWLTDITFGALGLYSNLYFSLFHSLSRTKKNQGMKINTWRVLIKFSLKKAFLYTQPWTYSYPLRRHTVDELCVRSRTGKKPFNESVSPFRRVQGSIWWRKDRARKGNTVVMRRMKKASFWNLDSDPQSLLS